MESGPGIPSIDDLRDALEGACKASYVPNILRGRAWLLSAPTAWVLAHVERVAAETINWNDEWEYRRLLELYALLDPRRLSLAIGKGLTSHNPEVREAAEDFRDPDYVQSIREDPKWDPTNGSPGLGRLDQRESDQDDSNP